MKNSKRLAGLLQRVDLLPTLRSLFVVILCIKLLSACTVEPVTLSFVVPKREAEYWRPLVNRFQQKNPNIHIDLANIRDRAPQNPDNSDELKAIYTAGFEGKSQSYDLIYTDIIWLAEFVEKGWLLDISDEFSESELRKDFLDSEVDNGYYNEKLYRIPFRTDIGVLYYRKDLLRKVNEQPPKTFDDLIRIAQKVKQKEGTPHGYLWQGRQSEGLVAMYVEVLQGYGGFWIDAEKNVGLNRPEAIQAVNFLRDTIDKSISPQRITTYQEDHTRRLFRRGEAVFMRNWPNVWVDVNGANSDVSGKIAIKPMVSAQGHDGGGCKGGWGFAIATKASNKTEAALSAIKFFTSAASQRQFALAYGSVPSRRKLFLDPKIVTKYKHYPDLLKAIEHDDWVTRPRLTEYTQASSILQKYLSAALNKEQTPEQAMSAATKELQSLLKKNT